MMKSALLGVCFSVAAGWSAAQAAPVLYTYTTFGVPGLNGQVDGGGINDSGQLAGTGVEAAFPDPVHGFVSSADHQTFTKILIAGSQNGYSYVNGINDPGQVVGSYPDASSAQHGFVRSADGSRYDTFLVPGSFSTVASGINATGQVVGSYRNPRESQGSLHGFIRSADGSTYNPIDFPGAISGSTSVFGINDTGQVVGHTFAGGFLRSADGRTFTPIVGPGGLELVPYGINNAGLTAGAYSDARNLFHGFVRSADGLDFTPIDVPGSFQTFVYGINNLGQVYGTYGSASGNGFFFATPPQSVPEPASFALLLVGGMVAAARGLKSARGRPRAWAGNCEFGPDRAC